MKTSLDSLDQRRRVTAGIRAFSLVEVVLAIAVFAFAAISLLGLLTMAMQSSRRAETQAACAAIVTTEMGKFSSQNFTSNVDSLPFTNYFTANGTPTNSASDQIVYRCSVADVSAATVPTSYMRQVSLVISWPSPNYPQTNQVVGSFVKYGN